MINVLLNIVLILISIFMILVILIQRGKGGGLAGAFGAVGGSSAFGTRAGDVFTRITVGIFAVWLVLSMILVVSMTQAPKFTGGTKGGQAATDAQPKEDTPGSTEVPAPPSPILPDAPAEAPKAASKDEKKAEPAPAAKTPSEAKAAPAKDASAKPAEKTSPEAKPAPAKEASAKPAEKTPSETKAAPAKEAPAKPAEKSAEKGAAKSGGQ